MEKKKTMSRLEISEDGQTAWLEFELDGAGWMTIWHTEVPEALRGRGLATELVKSAFEYARANELQVDVICPIALRYLQEHPEVRQGLGVRG
jgi:uncharacterized protein